MPGMATCVSNSRLEEAYIDVSNKGHLFDIMDASGPALVLILCRAAHVSLRSLSHRIAPTKADMGGNLSLDELVDGLMALRGTALGPRLAMACVCTAANPHRRR